MTEILNTKKRDYTYNGPVYSSDYNARLEENYKDLVFLYNKANVLDSKLAQAFERVLKDHKFLSMTISDLSDRIKALEAAEKKMSIHSFSQIDNASFINSQYAVSGTEVLTFDPIYNVITLPKIISNSYSKLKFGSPTSGQIIPDFFRAKVENFFPGVDTGGAALDMTPIYNSILDSPDKVWKRTIISDSSHPSGAQMTLYFGVPGEETGALKSNCLKINPFPAFGVSVANIQYTTTKNPKMEESDGWESLNKYHLYDDNVDALGKVPPGGWTTAELDIIHNSGPLCFYFPDTEITAFRIKFVQKNYFVELQKYIYTYGLSDLDVRFDKFLPSGRTMIKFRPSNGNLINEVISVTPKIYNVPDSLLSSAFSYRIFYKNGDYFSLENPGASTDVWIEVTLNMMDDKTPPVLSDLIVDYD